MLLDVTSTSVLNNNIFLCLCFAVFVGSYYWFCSFCEFVCVCCAMGFMPEINIYIHTYIHLTIPTFIQLYISMVRSHLDCCSSVWAPYRKGDIEALEKVQKRATKFLPGLKNLPYSERLKICKIPTLHYRRIREI